MGSQKLFYLMAALAVPGEWIVQDSRLPVLLEHSIRSTASPLTSKGDIWLVRNNHLARQLQVLGLRMEPNLIWKAIQNPPMDMGPKKSISFDEQWSLSNHGQPDPAGRKGRSSSDIDAKLAWKNGGLGSQSVTVAVVDTGIDATNTDIKTKLVDGYNVFTQDGNFQDDEGHGTHVSGIIGGSGSPNSNTMVGVARNVSLMGVKFLNSEGSGDSAGAIRAIDWAAEHGARVINASWGGSTESLILKDTILKLSNRVLFVAAAGNDGQNTDKIPHYPSSWDLPNIISVACTTNQDKLSVFSNFGLKTVSIAAPGDLIISTFLENTYLFESGTSMAAPFVSAAAAVALAIDPKLSPLGLKQALINSSEKISSLYSKVGKGGRLNLARLVSYVKSRRATQE
jgi:subtilisin family serine protease